jgi:glycosyltransferase involved in cell wall biosynthesis
MRKNILFVSHSAELYGAERVLLQTIEGLNKEKFEPILALPRSGPLEEETKNLGVETVHVPSKWWLTEKEKTWKQPFSWLWNVKSIFRMSQLIRKRDIDLVFSNSAVNFTGALAAKWRRVPHIWSVHEILEGTSSIVSFLLGKRALVGIISALSTRIIVNSDATGLPFKQRGKVRKVIIGVKKNRGDMVPRSSLRQRFGFGPKDFVVGVVGKIYLEKGQKEVVEAISMIVKTCPQVRLLIVGEARDKSYYRKVQKSVLVNHLEKHVVVTGYQKEISSILSTIDLLVVASSVESFGRVALEAMSVKTPVLAVRRGGISEVISPGESGFLVESRNPEVLAQAIVSILENRELVRRVAETGCQIVWEKYSLENQIKNTERVLKECLDSESEDR